MNVEARAVHHHVAGVEHVGLAPVDHAVAVGVPAAVWITSIVLPLRWKLTPWSDVTTGSASFAAGGVVLPAAVPPEARRVAHLGPARR